MGQSLAGIVAVLVMLPAAVRPLSATGARRDRVFWLLLVLAVAGPVAYLGTLVADGWSGDLSATLWVSISASAILFTVLARISEDAWRLSPLLVGYLVVLGGLAVAGGAALRDTGAGYAIGGWLLVHIVISVVAYALATVAAVAAAAVVIKQRALKRKASGNLSRLLPAVAVADRLQVRLLATAAGVLGLDILVGMATELAKSGALIHLEHKTLLSGLAFAVTVVLLGLHARAGVRGRSAARGVLVAYLLLTLGYPGVKFVTDVLLS